MFRAKIAITDRAITVSNNNRGIAHSVRARGNNRVLIHNLLMRIVKALPETNKNRGNAYVAGITAITDFYSYRERRGSIIAPRAL